MSNQSTHFASILSTQHRSLTLDRLSLVEAKKQDMQTWISNQSMLNLGETARQFFITLKELSQLKINDHHRIVLVELIRPHLYTIIASLSRHYFNQNLNIETRAERIAVLVQEMRLYLFDVYHGAAKRIAAELNSKTFGLFQAKQKKILLQDLALALHRSLTELAGLLYELQTLYLATPKGLWLTAHHVFDIASEFNIADTVIEDKTNTLVALTNIQQAYARLIIMGTINSNKLRQTEIRAIYLCSECWAPALSIDTTESLYTTHVINLSEDTAPTYITKRKEKIYQGFFINSQPLLQHFKTLVSAAPQYLHPQESKYLSTALKFHLLSNFSSPAERMHKRHPYQGQLEISFGIVSAHYHLSDRRAFEDIIHIQRDYDIPEEFLAMSNFGSIEQGIEVDFPSHQQQKVSDSLLKQCVIYQSQVVNISPGGYCLQWNSDVPNTLRTGELTILRESTDQNWHIGLIRWVNQRTAKQVEFGVEIISSRAKPCGIRASHKNDEIMSYKRALLLPEIQSLNRPATLLAPAFSFHVNQKIYIRHGNEEIKARLNAQHLITQSFIQFQYIVEEPEYSSTQAPKKHTIQASSSTEEDEIWKIL